MESYKGDRLFRMTPDGVVTSYGLVPPENGSYGHVFRVLIASLQKSMLLQELISDENKRAGRSRCTDELPDGLIFSADTAAPVLEALGISYADACLLIHRALALEVFLHTNMLDGQILRRTRDGVRRCISASDRKGTLASLLRTHASSVAADYQPAH